MTTLKTLALAAALLTTTSLCSAQAGGLRVGFGFPLGSFTVHPNLSSGPGGTARGRGGYEHCEHPKSATRSHSRDDDAPARRPKRAPKVEVADEEPAPKKVHRQPKVEVAEDEPAPKKVHRQAKAEPAQESLPARIVKVKADDNPVEIKATKLELKSVVSHAAPTIYIPEAPINMPQLSGTQSTPAPVTTASLGPLDIKSPQPATALVPVAEPLKTTEVSHTEVEAKATKTEAKAEPRKSAVTTEVKKLCRKFSAAVASLVDVPCGD